MSSIKVTLGEVDYNVPKLTIGQIEELTGLDGSGMKWTVAALQIVMLRAAPPIADVREVEAEIPQMREAVEKMMRASGFTLPDPKNLEAPDQNPGQGDG